MPERDIQKEMRLNELRQAEQDAREAAKRKREKQAEEPKKRRELPEPPKPTKKTREQAKLESPARIPKKKAKSSPAELLKILGPREQKKPVKGKTKMSGILAEWTEPDRDDEDDESDEVEDCSEEEQLPPKTQKSSSLVSSDLLKQY